MVFSCNLCGAKQSAALFPGRDRMHGVTGSFAVVSCKNCGLLSCQPPLSQAKLAKYYPKSGYYSFQPMDAQSRRAKLERSVFSTYGSSGVFKKMVLLPIRPLFRGTKIVPGGRVLDVGCGSGAFLHQMKLLGMMPYGVEPGDYDEMYAKKHGLRITKGTLESARYKSNFFDVITINHVFEHVDDPTKTLLEARRILKPGGTLIIGVPQTRSLAAKLFGQYWVQLDVPRHRYLFSTKNLKEYAKKTGFSVQMVRYNSLPFQFTGSLLYVTNRFRKKEKLLQDYRQGKITFLLLLPLAYLCNMLRIGDQVEIVLQKPR